MGSALGAHKDIEKLARIARRAGWEVFVNHGTHITWRNGAHEFRTGLTVGGQRAKEIRSRLRRFGVAV